jgi:formate-dependent phosphoribosylglycinamide formyltransferase (GAR transformylase)
MQVADRSHVLDMLDRADELLRADRPPAGRRRLSRVVATAADERSGAHEAQRIKPEVRGRRRMGATLAL